MNWAEVLTIITSIGTIMGGLIIWLDPKHREDMKEMDERWRWLFERTNIKLDQLRSKY